MPPRKRRRTRRSLAESGGERARIRNSSSEHQVARQDKEGRSSVTRSESVSEGKSCSKTLLAIESAPDKPSPFDISSEGRSQPVCLKPGERPRIEKMERNNDLFERLASFIPQLKESNKDLEDADKESMSMENPAEHDHHIEMELLMGVLEEKTGEDDSSGELDELLLPRVAEDVSIEEI